MLASMGHLWKIIRAGWRFVAAAGLLIGIIYIPADILGLPGVYPRPFKWIERMDREVLLILLSIILVLYVGWMDLRPFILRQLREIRPVAGAARAVSKLRNAMAAELQLASPERRTTRFLLQEFGHLIPALESLGLGIPDFPESMDNDIKLAKAFSYLNNIVDSLER